MTSTAIPSAITTKNDGGFYTILKATLLAGSLDIILALLQYYLTSHKNPELVLKFIASAVFGPPAFSGGIGISLTGLLFHFLITFVWATIFFFMYPSLNRLVKNSIVTGVVYAIVIWLVMNFMVVPLSKVPRAPFNITQALTGILILIVAIGVPFALIMKKHYRKHSL